MTESSKKELLDQIELDIHVGFEKLEELYESISEMFSEEEDFDKVWFHQVLSEKYQAHKNDAAGWIHTTDFEKLAKCFDELAGEKIVCLHHAGFTRSDGEAECEEAMENLTELGFHTIGYCYYHAQDVESALDPNQKTLYLGFGSVDNEDKNRGAIAKIIREKLITNGFTINWNNDPGSRLAIKNIDWKKIPDDHDRDPEIIFQKIRDRNKTNRPFWKFWK